MLKSMLTRIATAVVLLAVVFGCLFGLRHYNLIFADIIGLVFAYVGVFELYKTLKVSGYKPIALALIIACVISYPLTYFFGESGILFTALIGGLVAITIFTFKHEYELNDLFSTMLCLIYPLAICLLFIVINQRVGGLQAIVLTLFIPILTDTTAYFTGVTFKGKKLCPNISPKKTISGAIGGLIGGVLGGYLTFVLFEQFDIFSYMGTHQVIYLSSNKTISLVIYLVFGLICGAISEVGDLGASWIKRKAGIKDFGKIFPGHGGILDRIDSIMFVMVFTYALFKIKEVFPTVFG